MDFFNQGIPLGRWFGTQVVVGYSHLIMLYIFGSTAQGGGPLAVVMIVLVLFASILLHEFGHAFACKAVGGRADMIVMGPMGGLTMTQPPDRPLPQFITTAGGPAVNVLLLAAAWGIYNSGWLDNLMANGTDLGVGTYYFLTFMLLINKMLLVLNLLPIFPMDGGRLLQQILWPTVGYRNSILVTGMVGTVGGIALLVVGTGAFSINIPVIDEEFGNGTDYFLIFIGLTCALQSFALYRRAQEIEGWRKN